MKYSSLRATRDPAALFGLDKLIAIFGLAGVWVLVPIEAGLLPESSRSHARSCVLALFCAGGVILLGNKVGDWRVAREAGGRDRGLAVPLADDVTCVGRPAELRRLASELLKSEHMATRHIAFLTRGRWYTAMLCTILILNGLSVLGFSAAARTIALLATYLVLILESAMRFKTYGIAQSELHEIVRHCPPNTSVRNTVAIRSSAITCDLEGGIVCVGAGSASVSVDLGSLMRPHRFVVDLLWARFDASERRAVAVALRGAVAGSDVERGVGPMTNRLAIGDTDPEPRCP